MVIPNFWLMSCKSSSMEDVSGDPGRLWLRRKVRSADRRPGLWRLPLFVSVHRRAVRDMLRSVCQSYDFQKLQGFCSCFGFFSSPECTVGSRRSSTFFCMSRLKCWKIIPIFSRSLRSSLGENSLRDFRLSKLFLRMVLQESSYIVPGYFFLHRTFR